MANIINFDTPDTPDTQKKEDPPQIAQLLATLHTLDVRLRPMVTDVEIDAPAGVLTPALRETIRAHKQELLDLVEAFEQRAAIMEHEGGQSREDAEWQAFLCVQGEMQP
jgi:hypothetical protein